MLGHVVHQYESTAILYIAESATHLWVLKFFVWKDKRRWRILVLGFRPKHFRLDFFPQISLYVEQNQI